MAKILTIIPYKFYPPQGGGALRCFYILSELASSHDVYVLTSQPASDFEKEHSPAFPENVRVISTFGSAKYRSAINILPGRIADAINFRVLSRTLSEPTNSALLDVYPTVINLLNNTHFDVILYENLEALSLLGDIIKRYNATARHIYDAHNCDHDLWLQLKEATNNEKYQKYAAKALAVEKALYSRVDNFFCCSTSDLIKLRNLNNSKVQGWVIPNGVDIIFKPFDERFEKSQLKNLIFCGSLDYYPNKQGILWFYKEVFPLIKYVFPTIILTIVGSINCSMDYEELKDDPSVHFVGSVDSVVPYYERASVAVVPLLSGSGTRLKILEAMSMGNPVVSTTIGAEGVEHEAGKHLLISDSADMFAAQVSQLLSSEDFFNHVRYNAYKLVKEKYAWSKIGEKVNSAIAELLS